MADDDDSYRSLGQTVSDTKSQVRKGKNQRRGQALAGGLSAMGQHESDRADEAASRIGPVQYRKGGKIRKRKRGNKRMRARR